MKCPHCAVEIHAESDWVYLGKDAEGVWSIERYLCPNPDCDKLIFYLEMKSQNVDLEKYFLVNPRGSNRPPVPPQVPQN